jgi:hypothetical protein
MADETEGDPLASFDWLNDVVKLDDPANKPLADLLKKLTIGGPNSVMSVYSSRPDASSYPTHDVEEAVQALQTAGSYAPWVNDMKKAAAVLHYANPGTTAALKAKKDADIAKFGVGKNANLEAIKADKAQMDAVDKLKAMQKESEIKADQLENEKLKKKTPPTTGVPILDPIAAQKAAILRELEGKE